MSDVPDADLSATAQSVVARSFTRADLRTVRRLVQTIADGAGVAPEDRDDLVVVVSEIVTNAIIHGGGEGSVAVHCFLDTVMVEVCDTGPGLPEKVPTDRPAPHVIGGRGLWLAHFLAARIDITNTAQGVMVRIWAPRTRRTVEAA